VPLFLLLGIVAVVVAIIFTAGRGGADRARRFTGTAVAVWVGLVVLAIVGLTLATLIFGR
jgi:hypothetical protein